MSTGTLMPWAKSQWFDDAGAPAAAHKLFTYTAGTTTKLATYTDSALSVPNTNPIVLDASGRATVFLSPVAYKFVLAPPSDTDPPTDPLWTVDNVDAIPVVDQQIDISAVAGEDMDIGEVVYLSDGSGAKTAGRWYLGDSANLYSSTLPQSIGFVITAAVTGASGTVRLLGRLTGMSGLNTGSTYYISSSPGAITLTAPPFARAVAVAESATVAVIAVEDPPHGDVILYSESALTTATTGLIEEVLGTVTIPANSLGANGAFSGFEVFAAFQCAANTNNKTPRLRIDGLTGAATNIYTNDATSGNRIQFQDTFMVGTGGTTLNGLGASTRVTGTSTVFGTPDVTGLDFTAALDVVATGETGTAIGDLTLVAMSLKLLRKQA